MAKTLLGDGRQTVHAVHFNGMVLSCLICKFDNCINCYGILSFVLKVEASYGVYSIHYSFEQKCLHFTYSAAIDMLSN